MPCFPITWDCRDFVSLSLLPEQIRGDLWPRFEKYREANRFRLKEEPIQ